MLDISNLPKQQQQQQKKQNSDIFLEFQWYLKKTLFLI